MSDEYTEEDFYTKELQDLLDKGEVKIIDLGLINGLHRYRFIKKQREDDGRNKTEIE